jgi:hypothetical protein
MCSYLEWQLNVDPSTLRDFAGPGPYPPAVLPQPVLAPFAHKSNITSTGSIPAFASCTAFPKDAPVIPSPSDRIYPSIIVPMVSNGPSIAKIICCRWHCMGPMLNLRGATDCLGWARCCSKIVLPMVVNAHHLKYCLGDAAYDSSS